MILHRHTGVCRGPLDRPLRATTWLTGFQTGSGRAFSFAEGLQIPYSLPHVALSARMSSCVATCCHVLPHAPVKVDWGVATPPRRPRFVPTGSPDYIILYYIMLYYIIVYCIMFYYISDRPDPVRQPSTHRARRRNTNTTK